MRHNVGRGFAVALRKESVDRNRNMLSKIRILAAVALRKESVDRNRHLRHDVSDQRVALRKESVDRNINAAVHYKVYVVALRKESVDRNSAICRVRRSALASLSARRAWIEIGPRRFWLARPRCRSPQGERG